MKIVFFSSCVITFGLGIGFFFFFSQKGEPPHVLPRSGMSGTNLKALLNRAKILGFSLIPTTSTRKCPSSGLCVLDKRRTAIKLVWEKEGSHWSKKQVIDSHHVFIG